MCRLNLLTYLCYVKFERNVKTYMLEYDSTLQIHEPEAVRFLKIPIMYL